MAQVTGNFETGVAGNTIATTDTGSATAFDTVSIGAGATLTYDATHKYGALAAKLTTGVTGVGVYLSWRAAFGAGITDSYGRFYLYAGANPAALTSICRGLLSASLEWGIRLETTGKLSVIDTNGVVQGTTVAAIALNQFVRVEYHTVQGGAGAGSVEVKLFNSPDSTTATETLTVPAISIGASIDEMRFGSINNVANLTWWFDNIVAGAAAYPGPVPTLARQLVTGPLFVAEYDQIAYGTRYMSGAGAAQIISPGGHDFPLIVFRELFN